MATVISFKELLNAAQVNKEDDFEIAKLKLSELYDRENRDRVLVSSKSVDELLGVITGMTPEGVIELSAQDAAYLSSYRSGCEFKLFEEKAKDKVLGPFDPKQKSGAFAFQKRAPGGRNCFFKLTDKFTIEDLVEHCQEHGYSMVHARIAIARIINEYLCGHFCGVLYQTVIEGSFFYTHLAPPCWYNVSQVYAALFGNFVSQTGVKLNNVQRAKKEKAPKTQPAIKDMKLNLICGIGLETGITEGLDPVFRKKDGIRQRLVQARGDKEKDPVVQGYRVGEVVRSVGSSEAEFRYTIFNPITQKRVDLKAQGLYSRVEPQRNGRVLEMKQVEFSAAEVHNLMAKINDALTALAAKKAGTPNADERRRTTVDQTFASCARKLLQAHDQTRITGISTNTRRPRVTGAFQLKGRRGGKRKPGSRTLSGHVNRVGKAMQNANFVTVPGAKGTQTLKIGKDGKVQKVALNRTATRVMGPIVKMARSSKISSMVAGVSAFLKNFEAGSVEAIANVKKVTTGLNCVTRLASALAEDPSINFSFGEFITATTAAISGNCIMPKSPGGFIAMEEALLVLVSTIGPIYDSAHYLTPLESAWTRAQRAVGKGLSREVYLKMISTKEINSIGHEYYQGYNVATMYSQTPTGSKVEIFRSEEVFRIERFPSSQGGQSSSTQMVNVPAGNIYSKPTGITGYIPNPANCQNPMVRHYYTLEGIMKEAQKPLLEHKSKWFIYDPLQNKDVEITGPPVGTQTTLQVGAARMITTSAITGKTILPVLDEDGKEVEIDPSLYTLMVDGQRAVQDSLTPGIMKTIGIHPLVAKFVNAFVDIVLPVAPVLSSSGGVVNVEIARPQQNKSVLKAISLAKVEAYRPKYKGATNPDMDTS